MRRGTIRARISTPGATLEAGVFLNPRGNRQNRRSVRRNNGFYPVPLLASRAYRYFEVSDDSESTWDESEDRKSWQG